MDDLHWLPGWRLRELILSGQVSPTEVVTHLLDRIANVDAHLHAFVTVAADEALADAGRLETEMREGAEPGPLFGVPVAVKDQYPTRGVRTTAGSLTLADYIPTADAAVVERLRAAGAVIIGKTNTPEFALFWRTRNRIAPETRNPWNLDRSPGGSSGGSAAAVAAGLVPVAIASDGGGSTRLPSAFCGVIGLLPGIGVVPNHGAIGRARLFDRIGPIARDSRDMATVMAVISGPDPRDPLTLRASTDPHRTDVPDPSVLSGRFGRWTVPAESAGADPAVLDIVAAAVGAVAAAGARVDDSVTELDLGYQPSFFVISSSDRYALHAAALFDDEHTRSLLTPYAVRMYTDGSTWTAADYARALDIRQDWIGRMQALFGHYGLLISPTVGFTAPVPPDDWAWVPAGIGAFTRLANFCGHPALSLPVGSVEGLPVGMQLMGPRGSEVQLLRVATALEAAGVLAVSTEVPAADRRD